MTEEMTTTTFGANAVVGVRYDATEIMSGVTEVLCCGTAILVEPGSDGGE